MDRLKEKNSDTSKGSKKVESERNAKREVGLKIKAENERGEKSKSEERGKKTRDMWELLSRSH